MATSKKQAKRVNRDYPLATSPQAQMHYEMSNNPNISSIDQDKRGNRTYTYKDGTRSVFGKKSVNR